jgi:hypothetical protein
VDANAKARRQFGEHSRRSKNCQTDDDIAEHQHDAREKSVHGKFDWTYCGEGSELGKALSPIAPCRGRQPAIRTFECFEWQTFMSLRANDEH